MKANKLKKILSKEEKTNPDKIAALEKLLGFNFPEDYKSFLLICNGAKVPQLSFGYDSEFGGNAAKMLLNQHGDDFIIEYFLGILPNKPKMDIYAHYGKINKGLIPIVKLKGKEYLCYVANKFKSEDVEDRLYFWSIKDKLSINIFDDISSFTDLLDIIVEKYDRILSDENFDKFVNQLKLEVE